MAQNLQISFGVIWILILMGGASAVIVNFGTYGPSEAKQLANSACGASFDCSDTTYATVTDATAILADGSTVAASLVSIRNATGANARIVELDWYLDVNQMAGNYSVVVLPTSQPSTFYFLPYINETDVSTNTSTWSGSFSVTSNTYQRFDVTNSVVESFNNLGKVKLRMVAVSTTEEQFAEIYLTVPPSMADFQIIPQGVSQAEINTTIENEWAIFSNSERNLTMSSLSCSLFAANGSQVANSSYFSYSFDSSGRRASARWFANSSIVEEGENYQISCQVNVQGVTLDNLEQYVYINPHKTIMERIAEFVTYVGYLIGFQQRPVSVVVIPEFVSSSATTNIVVSAMYGRTPVTGNSSTCTIDVIDATGTSVVTNQPMSVFGVSTLGMFNYSMNSTIGSAPYAVRSTCLVQDATGGFNNYTGIGTLSRPVMVDDIFEGLPTITLLQQTYVPGEQNQILVQLLIGSSEISNSVCDLTLYYSNFSKVIDAQAMTYSGEAGLYYYNWTPVVTGYGSVNFPARVECSGGSLGTKVAQATASMEVVNGVLMRSVT